MTVRVLDGDQAEPKLLAAPQLAQHAEGTGTAKLRQRQERQRLSDGVLQPVAKAVGERIGGERDDAHAGSMVTASGRRTPASVNTMHWIGTLTP